MPNFRTRFAQSTEDPRVRAKLFGIGSAGCNIVEGAQFPTVAFSTSSADLARSHAERKVLIGQDRLLGLSDAGPDLMKRLPTVVGHELLDIFNNTEVAFIMCGLGGVTGSLGSKLLTSIAKAKGAMGIALVAMPFSAESFKRREVATSALADLLGASAMCVAFDNDKLSSLAPNLPLSRAFGLLNGIMLRPVIDLCATMSRNDLSIVREIVGGATYARFGLGMARGDERLQRVVDESLSSPWFDYDIKEATAAIAVYSAADPWDKEIDKILGLLEGKLPSIRILWGSYADPRLGDRIRLSLLICRSR
jgi:cell division protein FtsZ